MTVDFRQILTGSLRLSLLRVLTQAPGYEANCSVLHQSVEQLGIRVTRDQVRAELAWLRDQGCVTMIEATPTLFVATLTERGSDIARGRSTVPGIPQPSPGSGQ